MYFYGSPQDSQNCYKPIKVCAMIGAKCVVSVLFIRHMFYENKLNDQHAIKNMI